MAQTKTSVQLKNLSTAYRGKGGIKFVSQGLNVSIRQGEFVALLGTNGCGKSTLLRTIAGLQEAFVGQVFINEADIQSLSNKEKARLLSLVLTDKVQSNYFLVEDIVSIGRYPHIGALGILSKQDKAIIDKSLKQCNLESYKTRDYSDLSDGEKQRVMLARALAQDTALMMLDEATAHLDLPSRVELMKMLRDLAKETQKAILLSTHELDLALQWCDTIWLMNKDGNLRVGAPEDLVLNGSFSEVFDSELFNFDIPSGLFKINKASRGNIHIKGEAIKRLWTKKAVEREGFTAVEKLDKADYSIEIFEDNWIFKQGEKEEHFPTIEKLCDFLASL